MIWWFHIVIKSSWNILSSIVHKSSKQIRKCVKWSIKRGYNRHPVSSVGRAPVCRAGSRTFKSRPDRQSGSFFKKSGEIMLATIWDLVSVKVIASLGSDVKPLVLSPSSSFQQSKSKGTKKNPHYCSKEKGKFPRWCGLPFTHHTSFISWAIGGLQ